MKLTITYDHPTRTDINVQVAYIDGLFSADLREARFASYAVSEICEFLDAHGFQSYVFSHWAYGCFRLEQILRSYQNEN